MAAAAFLTFNSGQETFSRKTLLETMKTTKTFFKPSYTKNLSNYLIGLTKDEKLTETATDTYGVAPKYRGELERLLREE